jgi:ribonuclease P protein component
MKSAANNLSYNRGGVIVGKSSGGATERNKIRRMIMNLFQNSLPESKKEGKDFVILVGPNTKGSKVEVLKKELETYGNVF